MEISSYLIEKTLSHIIHQYHDPYFTSHSKQLFKLLKFYVKYYHKWFEIEIPSLGFKYNELSKLALLLKKGKNAKFFCEEAWKRLSVYFADKKEVELEELKKRMKTVELLLDGINELKKEAEKKELLKID